MERAASPTSSDVRSEEGSIGAGRQSIRGPQKSTSFGGASIQSIAASSRKSQGGASRKSTGAASRLSFASRMSFGGASDIPAAASGNSVRFNWNEGRKRSISSQLKQRRSLNIIEQFEAAAEEEEEDDVTKGDFCFDEFLQRLSEEHAREVSFLRAALRVRGAELGLSRPSLPPGPPPDNPAHLPFEERSHDEAGAFSDEDRDEGFQSPGSSSGDEASLPRSLSGEPPANVAAPQTMELTTMELTTVDGIPEIQNLIGDERQPSKLEAETSCPVESQSQTFLASQMLDAQPISLDAPGMMISEDEEEDIVPELPKSNRASLRSRFSSEEGGGGKKLSVVVPSQAAADASSERVRRSSAGSSNRRAASQAGRRSLPRIAGLKRNGSCLKQRSSSMKPNSSMKSSVRQSTGRSTSVMFDNTLGSEDGDQADSGDTIVALSIWQSIGEQRSQLGTQASSSFLLQPKLTRENLSWEQSSQVFTTFSSFGQGVVTASTIMDSLVSHPNSNFNFIFDVLSILCICYDLVMLPLGVFPVEDTVVTDLMHAFTTLFWTSDFIRHFFKGHYSQGEAVMVFHSVAARYLRTWALLDTFMVCGDWAEWFIKLFDSENTNSDVGKLLRSIRNLRSLRLLRGMKTAQILKMIEDRINSEVLGTLWNVAKLLIVILCATHLMACTWYWLGGISDAAEPNWHSEYLDTHPSGDTFLYKYTTSFHWAITQFTPASIKVQPENSVERLFAIFCLLWAFVTMSTFISGLTSAVMQLRQLSSAKHKQFWLLRKYLTEGRVPTQLAVRITNYCQHAWTLRGKRSMGKNVELLQLLSTSLRVELKVAMFSPHFTHHAFFMLLHISAPYTIRTACDTAVEHCELNRGDDLFTYGEDANHMFFTERNQLAYKFGRAHKDAELITCTDWVAEACLWTFWCYRGTLTAVTESVAVAVESDTFGKIVTLNADARLEALAYAKSFIQGINRETPWKLNDLYTSSLIEGLWFRLLRDFQVTKSMHSTRVSDKNYRWWSRSGLADRWERSGLAERCYRFWWRSR